MNNSRVNKYRELREGIKEEVGINREGTDDNVNNSNSVDEDDDFLLSVNRAFRSERKEPDIEDTLTEAKTFEQMQRESSEEIDRALRSAKVSVGKAAHYNTRMDILNKIREPEKQVVRLNKFDNVSTSQFSKGFFVNGDDEELIDEISDKSEKKKMTLMERLASMSPEEDAKKAKLIMEEENVFEDEEENEELDEVTEPVLEQTKSLEPPALIYSSTNSFKPGSLVSTPYIIGISIFLLNSLANKKALRGPILFPPRSIILYMTQFRNSSFRNTHLSYHLIASSISLLG